MEETLRRVARKHQRMEEISAQSYRLSPKEREETAELPTLYTEKTSRVTHVIHPEKYSIARYTQGKYSTARYTQGGIYTML